MNLEKTSNPYAPPQSSVDTVLDHCWREGKLVVVPVGNKLPPRCVKCNAPADLEKPRAFAWHHPGWYLFIPLNIILYAVIAMLVQKRAKVALGLCVAHRARRRKFTLTAVALLLMAVVGVYFAAIGENPALGGMSLLAFLAALIVAIIGSRSLHPARISADEVRLKGASPAFLDSLPGC